MYLFSAGCIVLTSSLHVSAKTSQTSAARTKKKKPVTRRFSRKVEHWLHWLPVSQGIDF